MKLASVDEVYTTKSSRRLFLLKCYNGLLKKGFVMNPNSKTIELTISK